MVENGFIFKRKQTYIEWYPAIYNAAVGLFSKFPTVLGKSGANLKCSEIFPSRTNFQSISYKIHEILISKNRGEEKLNISTRMGFEPTRAEPNG